jgi:hypothetical protein
VNDREVIELEHLEDVTEHDCHVVIPPRLDTVRLLELLDDDVGQNDAQQFVCALILFLNLSEIQRLLIP